MDRELTSKQHPSRAHPLTSAPPPLRPPTARPPPKNNISGSDVYQRLTPPITELKPSPSVKLTSPFQCEVLLCPSSSPSAAAAVAAAGGGTGISAKPAKASVAYFFRGWADVLAPAKSGQGACLMQHVAPRSARVVFLGGGGGDDDGDADAAADTGRRRRAARAASPTPPLAVFSALGAVGTAAGGRRRQLEKLARQEVAYVGKQLRIGRTRGGDVYVYERCAWPEELEPGLVV